MLGWEWFTEPNTLSVFIYLLLSARHNAGCWRGIELEAGQCITSREKISQSTGLSIQEVRTSIARLKSTNEITTKTTNKYTIVTITNYVNYQGLEDNEQPTTQPTTQQTNNQQTTNNQPAINHKQEYKNNKNNRIKEDDIKSTTDVVPKDEPSKKKFIKPTIEEIQAYCTERGNGISAERFFAYYEANGWRVGRNPMKDWRAAVRTWEQQDGGRVKRQQRESTEQEERARFEAQMEIERKKDVERRRAQEEQEVEEYRQKEVKRINDIIYGNNTNNDNNK